MISPLDRKLLRDLARMKGQVVAVSLVMACGLAMMIMTRSLILTLESTRAAYYQQYAMADVFATLETRAAFRRGPAQRRCPAWPRWKPAWWWMSRSICPA